MKKEEVIKILDGIRNDIEKQIRLYERSELKTHFIEGCIAGLRHTLTLIPLSETINVKCEDR